MIYTATCLIEDKAIGFGEGMSLSDAISEAAESGIDAVQDGWATPEEIILECHPDGLPAVRLPLDVWVDGCATRYFGCGSSR